MNTDATSGRSTPRPGLLLDDRRQHQRLVRRAQRQVRLPPRPCRREPVVERAIRALQQREIAASPGHEIGVREEQSFRVGLGRADARKQFGVGKPGRRVGEFRIPVQRLAQLRERRAFDDRHRRLQDVALCQLVEQSRERDAALDLVTAGLDRAIGALDARERHQRCRMRKHALVVQCACDAGQRCAGVHLEIVGTARQRQRNAMPRPCDRGERRRCQEEQRDEECGDRVFSHRDGRGGSRRRFDAIACEGMATPAREWRGL